MDEGEERIKWLRERGVQVHIPGEKVDPKHEIKFPLIVVRIPVDTRLPLEEVILDATLGRAGDQCLELLKPFFSKDAVSASDLDKTMLSEISASMSNQLNISESSINNQLQQGGAEAFHLAHPCKENDYSRVSAYLDEASQLKHLPRNERATLFAALCGYDNVPLCGDIFMGRLVVGGSGEQGDGQGPVRNLDFRLEEASSDAKWLKNIKALNYAHGIRTNQVSMSKDDAPGVETGVETEAEAAGGQVYRWSQTSESVEVSLTLPEGTSKRNLTACI